MERPQMKLDEVRTVLQNNIVIVDFLKKDGTLRTMLCTLKEDYLPPVEFENLMQDRKRPEDSIAVWDLDKEGWRSFRIDSIQRFKIEA